MTEFSRVHDVTVHGFSMIYSMTGYAAASREFAYGVLNLELRSVNHRYLDIQFRLPDELRSVESQLREAARGALRAAARSSAASTFATGAGARKALQLNEDLLRELAALSGKVRGVLPDAGGLRAADVLRWPGMLGADTARRGGARSRRAASCSRRRSRNSRPRARAKARRLKALLLERVAAMETHIAGVAPRIPQAVAAFQEKLAARLKEALAGGDDERIRQEVALFADQDRRRRGAVAARDPRRRS